MSRTKFFDRLNYSFGNEDWKTENTALQIQPDSHILCITASGDRPLHLLLNECRQVTSVDASLSQNQLLHLKCAALETFDDYAEYLAFLGATPHTHRKEAFKLVAHNLNSAAAAFWQTRLGMIQQGILYQGRIERLLKGISAFLGLVRPNKIKKLFQFDDLADQKLFVKNHWDTFFMRKAFDLALSRTLSRCLAIDPGLYANKELPLGSYIYSRMLSCLHHYLAKEDLLISLIFRGFVGPEAFPPYLKREGFSWLRERLCRLNIETTNILSHLTRAPSQCYDRFSLSDVASYITQQEFDLLMTQILRTAKPGARFCIRQFSSNHIISPLLEPYFVRERPLEALLEREDRCFVYRFMVGSIPSPIV